MRVLIAILLSTVSLLAQSSQPASDDTQKTIHVRQYTRKDGTVVHSYNRAAPGTTGKNGAVAGPVPSKASSSSNSRSSARSRSASGGAKSRNGSKRSR
jgi:hypothetical protein